jgi:hypothetical protein
VMPSRLAQCLARTCQAVVGGLFVWFSDDRRFFVPVLVVFLFFVLLIIIIGGISGRHRVAAHDGDEAPNVVRDPWSHFGSCLNAATFTGDASARARGRQSVCIAPLHLATYN